MKTKPKQKPLTVHEENSLTDLLNHYLDAEKTAGYHLECEEKIRREMNDPVKLDLFKRSVYWSLQGMISDSLKFEYRPHEETLKDMGFMLAKAEMLFFGKEAA